MKALRRRAAAILLAALAAVAALAPPAHLALEALHASETPVPELPSAAFAAACPGECADPHHRHAAHDEATCAACRTLGAASLATAPVLHAPRTACEPPSVAAVRVALARPVGPGSPRGPPQAG